MAKPKAVASKLRAVDLAYSYADGDENRTDQEVADRLIDAPRPRSRMVEVKRTLRYSKAYQYPVGHPMHGQGRVFSPGQEDEVPDDFPEGPWWSDYDDGSQYATIDTSGRTVSLVPEGIDPSSITENLSRTVGDAENLRLRREALAALGPQGLRGAR